MNQLVFAISLALFLNPLLSGQVGAPANQRTSLTFQAVTRTLGMSEEAVRAALRPYNYTLTTLSQGMGFIGIKDPSSDNAFSAVLAIVDFRGGRLVKARAMLKEKTDLDLADALYGVLSSLKRAGNRCEISTERSEQPGIETKTLDIWCGSRGVNLLIVHGSSRNPSPGVTVQETLLDPRSR